MSTKENTCEFILESLLPDALPSRLKMAERSLSMMTDEQLAQTKNAVIVGMRERSLSRIRDIVEARDLISIKAISRWDTIINISLIEAELNAQFSERDEAYDIYSPTFEAHVEAYVTYHNYCVKCQPYDLDMDYTELDESEPIPLHGHYVDYLQDYSLMSAVEEYPERVSDLVKLAAERRGINRELLKDHLAADASALSSGLL